MKLETVKLMLLLLSQLEPSSTSECQTPKRHFCQRVCRPTGAFKQRWVSHIKKALSACLETSSVQNDRPILLIRTTKPRDNFSVQ